MISIQKIRNYFQTNWSWKKQPTKEAPIPFDDIKLKMDPPPVESLHQIFRRNMTQYVHQHWKVPNMVTMHPNTYKAMVEHSFKPQEHTELMIWCGVPDPNIRIQQLKEQALTRPDPFYCGVRVVFKDWFMEGCFLFDYKSQYDAVKIKDEMCTGKTEEACS